MKDPPEEALKMLSYYIPEAEWHGRIIRARLMRTRRHASALFYVKKQTLFGESIQIAYATKKKAKSSSEQLKINKFFHVYAM